MVLHVLTPELEQVAQLSQYESLSLGLEYAGVGEFSLTLSPKSPSASLLAPGQILYPQGRTDKAVIVESMTQTADKLTLTGCQLKGLARRRITVAPMTLPASLWRYMDGAWTQLTDAASIRQALCGDMVYQGYTRPASLPQNGYWLDMSQLSAVYDWRQSASTGTVWMEQETAQRRSQYQNFGWDRFTGSGESALYHYAHGNMIAPEDDSRRIERLIAATDLGRGDIYPWQARFSALDVTLKQIADTTGLGWRIVPEPTRRRMRFEVFQGMDRSQSPNTVIIAMSMGNANEVTRTHMLSGSATTVYAGGAGEDENRLVLCVGQAAGVDRREAFFDAGSQEDAALLRMYAQQKLDGLAAKHTLKATLTNTGACLYERDYALGDVLLVRGYGYESVQRLTGIRETYENGERRLEATFGQSPATLSAALRGLGGAVR